MYYVHSFLTQLCLLSLGILKQTTYLLLKCTAEMFAFCGQQRLNLASGTCAIPRLRAVVVFVKPTPYVFKWRKKCQLNGASCPCHLLQVGCSCQTHTREFLHHQALPSQQDLGLSCWLKSLYQLNSNGEDYSRTTNRGA